MGPSISLTFSWGIPQHDRDQAIDSGLLEILGGDLRPAGIDVVRDQLAARLSQRQAEPNARVPVRRADLDHGLGAQRFRQQAQQASVLDRDIHVATALVLVHLFQYLQDLLFRFVLALGRRAELRRQTATAPGTASSRTAASKTCSNGSPSASINRN